MRARGVAVAVIAIIALLAWRPSAGATGGLPADLAAAAADYDRAQVNGDRALLTRLLADDYRLVNGGGQVESKDQFIAESVDPGFTLDPFVVESPIETVWSDAAVLAGEVHLSGKDHGRPFRAHFRFADVWRKRDGHWQVVFTEVTRLPPDRSSAPDAR